MPAPRRRWRAVIAIGAALAVAAAAVAAVVAVAHARDLRIQAVTPAPGTATRSATPSIRLRLSRPASPQQVTVSIDGEHTRVRVEGGGRSLTVRTPRLADGTHWIAVDAKADGLLGGSASKRWRFVVDTTAPPLALERPLSRYVTATPLVLAGHTQPGTRVRAEAGGRVAAATAAADGAFRLRLALRQGPARLRLQATDPAGNRHSETRAIVVDTRPPQVAVKLPWRVDTGEPSVSVRVHDTSPVSVHVTVDGLEQGVVARDEGGGAVVSERFSLTLAGGSAPLANGLHALRVRAADATGHHTLLRRRFLVDTTEQLGAATLVRGARGADVRDLQSLLHDGGYQKGKATGVLDAATERAVRRFQRAQGLGVDGVVGPSTVGALMGHIVIDQSEHRLTLYRLGEPPISFPVAVGQPAYPTPDGDFSIVSMVKDPTWVPPADAAWAQGAVPIPPGPDNPLGTRWMGISAPGVGIHGTDDPASIGYSVSHGCIRMQVPDAERLFTMVSLGMRVHIQP